MHIAQSETTSDSSPPRPSESIIRSGRLIGLLVASAFVVILNETIMGVALPELMADFNVTASSAQWLTTAFLLTMAIVLPTSGYALQRFGLRRVFISAISLFIAGTALAGAAPIFEILIAARVVQACGTALMIPLLMTTVLTLVEPDHRGRMMGRISIVIAVAPAIGPTISGLILDHLQWRWMFWLVLPIALISLGLGLAWVKNLSEPVRTALDVPSVVLSALAFGGLIYGLSSVGDAAAGHARVSPWVPIFVGAVALAVFVVRQLRLRDRALLDLRVFGSRSFSVAAVLISISMAALFGSLILLPIYLQTVLGMSTLDTGLLLLPGGLLMGILAPFTGRAFDRVGPRPLVAPGAALTSVSLWLLTSLNTDSGGAQVIAIHMVLSVGLALMMTPLMASALGSLPPALYSHGSATITTLQQVAGAAGTAMFVTIMTRTQVATENDGGSFIEGTAAGVHSAFVMGGIVSAVAVLVALLVRRSADGAQR